MSLIIKPPSWGHCSSNFAGTPDTAVIGTALTAGANDTDGTAVSFLASLSHDVELLVIGVGGFFIAGGNGSTLLDILVDPAGGTSWSTKINDLLAGFTIEGANFTSAAKWYFFPIWLPAGCSIGGQARTAHTADITTGDVHIMAYGGNANPGSWWCGNSVETIGVDDTISQGTNHAPGSTGTFSAWTNFGSTLSKPCGALQFDVQGTNTDVGAVSRAYHFEFGAGSTRIGPTIYRGMTTNENGWMPPLGPIFSSLPAGTQLQVRATSSGTAEPIDVAAYAVM